MFEQRASASDLITAAAHDDSERCTAASKFGPWFAATLDAVDYGLVLLDEHALVLHINHAARAELDAEHPLQILGQSLRARYPRDVGPLHAALDATVRRGLRKLLTLGEEGAQVGISVVPLGALGQDGQVATLVMLGKRRVGSELGVLAFACDHGLTPGETRVLQALYEGLRPTLTASKHGVAITAVRTQIGSVGTGSNPQQTVGACCLTLPWTSMRAGQPSGCVLSNRR